MTRRRCAHCGEEYQAERVRGRGFCSSRCRTAAHRAANANTADHDMHWSGGGWTCRKCEGTWQRYPRGGCPVPDPPQDPRSCEACGGSESPGIKTGPMIVATLVLVILLAFVGCDSEAQRIREINEGLATPVAERTPLSAEITTSEIRDGDCINSTLPDGISLETVVIVPCAGTWQYRVLNSFDVADADRYPGEDFFAERAYESCDRRFRTYIYPHVETWNLGNRTVNCLQNSFGLSVIDPGKLDRLVIATSLGSRECFNVAPETDSLSVELVDCSGEWEFRVLNSFDVADAGRYPGANIFQQQVREYRSCDRRYSNYLFPDAESWGFGDRTVNCLQDSFGLSVIDPGKLDRLVSVVSLGSRECYNEAPETGGLLVELVDCSGEWEVRVLNSFDVADADRFPGANFFKQRVTESCDRRYSYLQLPNAETWNLGDRTVNCLQHSFGLSVIDPGKLDRLVRVASLSSRECFNEAPENGDLSVELVDCSGEWEFRVLNSFDVADADRYPGANFFKQRADESCDRRHSYSIIPSVDTWNLGDRTVKCLQKK